MNQPSIIQIYIQKQLVELPQSDIYLSWIDGNKNLENYYLTSYFQHFYNEKFSKFSFLDQFLVTMRNQSKENSIHIILTNETDGQWLTKKIEQKILILCRNKRSPLDFFMRTPNILYLVDYGIFGVRPLIQQYSCCLQNQMILQSLFNPIPIVVGRYYHCSVSQNIAFYIMSEYCKNQKTSDENILKEILRIEKESKKNQLSQDTIFQSQLNIFEKLIYSYTTEAIYDTLNRKFAQLDYKSVSHIMGCLYEGFSNLSENDLVKDTTVYRGLSFKNEKDQNTVLDSLKRGLENNQIFYWQTLTSTSQSLQVAKRFAFQNNKFGIVFLIQLTDHPAYSLPSNLTEFENELEVLLFPQFPFKVLNIKQGYVSIEQVENQIEIQNLKGSRKDKYWQNYFNKVIIPAMDQTIDQSFLRLKFILENYQLFEEKGQKTMRKFMKNELRLAFKDIEKNLNKIIATVKTTDMIKAFKTLFKSAKKNSSLSSTPNAIQSQIFQLKSLILDQSILLLKSQVFDLTVFNQKLKAINNTASWDLSFGFGIFVAIKGAIQDYWERKHMLEHAKVYSDYLQAMLSAMQKNPLELPMTEEEIAACEVFQNFAKSKFCKKINYQNCCDNQIVIPKLFYTHAAILVALHSLLSQILEDKCIYSKNVISKFYALIISAIPYLEKFVEDLTNGLIDLGDHGFYFNIFITLVLGICEIVQISKNKTLSEKQQQKKIMNELCKFLLQNGILILFSLLLSYSFGSLGLILGSIFGQFFSKNVISKFYSEKPFRIKVQFSSKPGLQMSPIIKIKNIDKKMKNIIILAFKADEEQKCYCQIIKKVQFDQNLIYIAEGAHLTDIDFIYFDPECIMEENIIFKAYGVADENINYKKVQKMIKKQISLQIIDCSTAINQK